MVKSMTGYGRAEETVNGCTITVELRSVNNRYLDCNIRLPRLYLFAEEAMKARIQNTISRGKVDVFVTLDNAGAEKVQVSVNKPVADGYYAALKQLAADYDLEGDISVSLLSRFPDVLLAEKAEEDVEQMAKDICSVLDRALADFDQMRSREGQRLKDDVLSRARTIEDKVALVGPNERANTVLFKILSGEMEPDEGSYKWGLTTSQAYFPKDNSAEFSNDDTIAEWLTQYSPEKDATYVRGFLGRMLFAGEDGVKKVKVLSGGEKVRCMLSKLMISGANVLMLDEPTDHLDMESIDALNRGMIKFSGVLIFSSRDHQIVQTTANRIMEIINGKLIDKITTYDEYLDSDEMARKRFTFTITESEEADD